MASYQSRGRDPLFDSNTQAALEKRSKELGGLAMIAAGLAVAMVLWSYSPDDPNWMLATDAPVQNWLGRFGASIAHPMTMIVGRGGWILSLVLLVWGARWALHRGEERIGRLVFAPIAIAMVAIYAATLTPPETWVHKFGMGGLFGDTVLSLILTILPVGLGFGVKLLSLGMAVVSVIAVSFCCGVSKAETRSLRAVLLAGSIWLYEKALSVAGGSASVSMQAAGGLQARLMDKLAERRARQAVLRAEAEAEAAAEAQAARIGRSTAAYAPESHAAYAPPPQAARVMPAVAAYQAPHHAQAPVHASAQAPAQAPVAPPPPMAAPAARKMVVRAGQAQPYQPPPPPAPQPSLPTMEPHRLADEDDTIFEDESYWPAPAMTAAQVAQRVAGQAAGVAAAAPVIPAPTLGAPARHVQRDIYGAVEPSPRAPAKGGLFSKVPGLLRRDRGQAFDELDEYVEAYEGEVPAGDRIKARIEDAIRLRGDAQPVASDQSRKLGPRPLIVESARPAAARNARMGEPPLTAAIAAAVAHVSEHPTQTPRAMFPVPPPPPVVPYGAPEPMPVSVPVSGAHYTAPAAQPEPDYAAHYMAAAPQAEPAYAPHYGAAAPQAFHADPRAARGYVPSGELVADATPTEFYGGDLRQKTRARSEPRLSAAPKPVLPSQLDAPVPALESFLAAPVTAQAAAPIAASAVAMAAAPLASAGLAARSMQSAVQGVVQGAVQGVAAAAAASVLPSVGRVASAFTAAPAAAARNYARPTGRIEPVLSAPATAPVQAAASAPAVAPVAAPPAYEPAAYEPAAYEPKASGHAAQAYVAPAPAAPVAPAQPVMRAPAPAAPVMQAAPRQAAAYAQAATPSYEQFAEDIAGVVETYGYNAHDIDPSEIDADGRDAQHEGAYHAPYDAPVTAPVAAPVAAPAAPRMAPLAADPRRGPAQALNRKAIQAPPAAAPVNRFADYEFPPLDLLMDPMDVERQHLSDEALEDNARLLESVLDDYGVKGEIVSVRPGPVVTMYELEPAPGLKASRVIGLADDIARSMSALSARVSTVPGRSVIGIELPNSFREKVVLREIIAARDFGDSQMRLPLALGKDIAGEPIVANLAKMPHLLIAGTTGSGKSVAINTMILSLLYKLSPEECRMIMIDPKMLELSVYDGIPHLLSPVVTDPKKAVVALKWVVGEMEERYRKMSKMGVRNIEGYNGRVRDALGAGETFSRTIQTGFDEETGDPIWETEETTPELLPYIVVVVDEMADLMMVAGKEIEACIQRLAQMARASGIHLIMATQRPSVDVITGTIKANFPTRISFQVTSKIDSRTILGEQGAEQLLGMGDMLYMAGGGRVTRIHGPFCSDGEVEEIVSFLKSYGPPDYKSGVTDGPDEDSASDIDAVLGLSSSGNETEDAMYDMAVQIVARDRKCSTSYIQRKLAIGYNKAARLVEQMETNGVVSAANAVGKREILVPEVH